ncbi:hypothetical protein [Pseudomonas sp. C2B4]|uniref:hypothetical protein n=1 Tax=Pseudomonas sp. C2B4 TaxID=2735270 RepID=UPI001586E8EA|nr:hypothetical protein [Pseudomonas sp. C2B4]NUU37807.1 hypothetical protein [Pseudomonas sp. C2B4]
MTSEKPQSEQSKRWIDLAKAAIWPVVIVFLVLTFYTPISGLLRNTVNSGASISELKLGTLEVRLSPSASKEIQPPDESLSKLLSSLTTSDVKFLLEWPDGIESSGACIGPIAPSSSPLWGHLSKSYIDGRIRESNLVSSLVDRKILLFERKNGYVGYACSPEGSGAVSLSEDGRRIKPFLIQLVSESLQFRRIGK